MAKMSVDDLVRIKNDAAEAIAFKDKKYCLICGGTGCHATGSIGVKEALEKEVVTKGLAEEVKVVETGCRWLIQGQDARRGRGDRPSRLVQVHHQHLVLARLQALCHHGGDGIGTD